MGFFKAIELLMAVYGTVFMFNGINGIWNREISFIIGIILVSLAALIETNRIQVSVSIRKE